MVPPFPRKSKQTSRRRIMNEWMAQPTREEFLSHVHAELVHQQEISKKGSPTKSAQRYRWRELRAWNIESEASDYWNALNPNDKTAPVDGAGYWDIARRQISRNSKQASSESGLQLPFDVAFKISHNIAIDDASDAHAEMEGPSTSVAEEPLSKADFFMVYEEKVCGLVELKTSWKVTAAQIEEVRSGNAPISGDHHGRLAIEQTYGYMCFDKVRYGILTTFNAFVFFKRENGGILYMSNTIPITATAPTVLQLLYFFSNLCALNSEPYPETNAEGIVVPLQQAAKTADKAPKIPDPNYRSLTKTRPTPNQDFSASPRRSPRFSESTSTSEETLCMDPSNLSFLGGKGWRGRLTNGRSVFAKLWDGWKSSSADSEHEASVYIRLRDLWASVVPEFIGFGQWGFFHILLLADIECPMLNEVTYTPQIGKNVVHAFKEIHRRGVCHGDVRSANILVRPDGSVVIVDFEMSTIDSGTHELQNEMKELFKRLTLVDTMASPSSRTSEKYEIR